MLILVADFGDDVADVLLGGFDDMVGVEAKIKEIEESTDAMDGADLILIDTKTLVFQVLTGDEGWLVISKEVN
jgi:frataxin-like iron-binding protein CyaY